MNTPAALTTHSGWMRGSGTLLGSLLVAASAVSFSTAGLLTRLIQLDTWTILFWRGLFGAGFLAACIVWQHRARTLATFRAIGAAGLVACACSTGATICFINSLRLTTVTDVMLIFAAVPFAAASIAWIWLRERASRTTLLASFVALLGVALMFGAARQVSHLAGDVLALAATVLIAMMMVIIRHRREISLLPAMCLSALASSVVVLPLSHPAAVDSIALLYLALFGTMQLGLGLLLLTIGTRLISAAQSALIGNLEVPLAPLWVWLAFGDTPSLMTCAGGAVVAAAVLGDILLNNRRQPAS